MGGVAFWVLVKRWWPYAAVVVGAVGLLVAVLWIRGERDAALSERDKARSELSQARADLAVLRTDSAAKETAAVERGTDNAAVAAQTKELTDAIKAVPDEAPDAVRVALGCQRLRRVGRAGEADLPAVCRSGS